MIIFRRFLYRFCTIILDVVKINYRGCGSVDCSFDQAAKREIRPVWRVRESASRTSHAWVLMGDTWQVGWWCHWNNCAKEEEYWKYFVKLRWTFRLFLWTNGNIQSTSDLSTWIRKWFDRLPLMCKSLKITKKPGSRFLVLRKLALALNMNMFNQQQPIRVERDVKKNDPPEWRKCKLGSRKKRIERNGKKDWNKAEMKERKKTTRHLQNTQQMSGSLLAFLHLCLVSILFSAPSIPKWNEVLEKLFSIASVLFRGFSKPPSK